MFRLPLLAPVAFLAACSGNSANDPDTWTCDSLIEPVIALSEERAVRIHEITDTDERQRFYGPRPQIRCVGTAEWSNGRARVQYGARVSDGNNIILSYERL